MEMLRGLGMDPSAETSWAPEIPTLTPAPHFDDPLIHIHILSKIHTHTPPHTLTFILTHTLTHTLIHSYTLTHTFIHTHSHSYTHTHTYIFTQ